MRIAKNRLDRCLALWPYRDVMRRWLIQSGFVKAAKAAGAVCCVALVLGLSLLGASPELHELIHHDAGAPDHECAITLFAHGQVHSAETAIPIVQFFAPAPQVLQSWRESVVASTDIPLLPGRGPPAPLPLLN